LADIFNPRAGRALRSTSWLKGNIAAIALVLLLAATGYMGWMYWKDLQEQERLAELARQQQLQQENLRRLQVPPWIGTPEVGEFVRACRSEIDRSILFVAGWTQQNLTCTHDSGTVALATAWQRSDGRIDWLLAAINQRGFPASLSPSLDTATLAAAIDVEKRPDDADTTPLAGQVLDRLLRLRFANLSVDVDLNQVAARAAPQQAQQQGVPIWNYHSLQFRAATPLDEYIRLISDLPAVVPEEMSYNVVARQWTIRVRVYHPAIGL
jgi:type II secretory pathway pseudopilin PulG